MTEVYKTNVTTITQSKKVINILKSNFSTATINFDLEDHDRILRVTGINQPDTKKVIDNLIHLGFQCEILN